MLQYELYTTFKEQLIKDVEKFGLLYFKIKI